MHNHKQNCWRETYWRPYTSKAPIPAMPITKLMITVRGGSAPPIGFPDSASYLANLFFGALHCGQPYSSGWKEWENGHMSSCKLENGTLTLPTAHFEKLILLMIWRRNMFYLTCSSKGLDRKYMYPQSRQMCVALAWKLNAPCYKHTY
jgi:hypothetical protein